MAVRVSLFASLSTSSQCYHSDKSALLRLRMAEGLCHCINFELQYFQRLVTVNS